MRLGAFRLTNQFQEAPVHFIGQITGLHAPPFGLERPPRGIPGNAATSPRSQK